MQKRNGGTNKKKTVLANKIGSIFSNACARSRTINMSSFRFGLSADDKHKEHKHDENDKERPISSAEANATKCLQLATTRHSSFSGILAGSGLRKWRSSLKKVARVKLRLKPMGNDSKAEPKTELELCKKRILMGEKCRALNLSGVLHYDKQGILLPED